MNKAILIGRLTRDPELRYTKNNVPVASFTIAINRTFIKSNGEKEADFINCLCFNKQAENVNKYLSKGSLVAVEGSIQTRSYNNKEGKKVFVTEVVANSVQFLESKKENGQAPKEEVTTEVETDPFENFGQEHDSGMEQSEFEIEDEDLPF